MSTSDSLHLAVALSDAGWHPAAWREAGARPAQLSTAGYWADLAATAERGLLDLLTIEDGFGLQSHDHLAEPDRRTDQVRGRLDAHLVAALLAPLTSRIGLVPTVTTTHTEPFHTANALATLDHDSLGRAGWRVQVSVRADEARHLGRRTLPGVRREHLDTPETVRLVAELFDEAADAVEVARRLWDSWEDDAEIRDDATNRFVDRDKLHHVDFTGPQFSVRGPAITPRPPQGHPLVAVLAHREVPYRLAARSADVVFVTPHDADGVRSVIGEVRAAEAAVGRGNADARSAGAPLGEPLRILADLVVLLDQTRAAAQERLARLDARAPLRSDAAILATTPSDLADLLLEWQQAGLDGFRLRPAVLPDDLETITDALVPELQRRGAFRTAYDETTLRGRFGLSRPANRYVTAGSTA
ncbi:LLM class flavin-dependent oxidoreductase [Pseudonocardia sp. KRD291]|uniref:LLM class flavin-dependent oxidoreductase n=1 Tax=Pseudonocardia sp. KRD291 TaxID=2792007 RepID=UPI001C4A2045|nr:LLM class flavin-dependent oxidoreductase [Pseudonocardia sp. KRD291]MBW0105641.1 LLM class flavin-dependent oxidoreductase [Pseudonocardia sp. KRD291]